MKYIIKSIKNKENKIAVVDADFITTSEKVYSQVSEIQIDPGKTEEENKLTICDKLCDICDYYQAQEDVVSNVQDFSSLTAKEIDSTTKGSIVVLKEVESLKVMDLAPQAKGKV